jgi:hypothetical protein
MYCIVSDSADHRSIPTSEVYSFPHRTVEDGSISSRHVFQYYLRFQGNLQKTVRTQNTASTYLMLTFRYSWQWFRLWPELCVVFFRDNFWYGKFCQDESSGQLLLSGQCPHVFLWEKFSRRNVFLGNLGKMFSGEFNRMATMGHENCPFAGKAGSLCESRCRHHGTTRRPIGCLGVLFPIPEIQLLRTMSTTHWLHVSKFIHLCMKSPAKAQFPTIR